MQEFLPLFKQIWLLWFVGLFGFVCWRVLRPEAADAMRAMSRIPFEDESAGSHAATNRIPLHEVMRHAD
jgi:cbb3-type cytochrome oxidase subunit 3